MVPRPRTTLIGLLCALSLCAQAPTPSRRSGPTSRQKRPERVDQIASLPTNAAREPDPVSSSIDQLSAQIKAWKDQQSSQYAQEHSSSIGMPVLNSWYTSGIIACGVVTILIAIWAGFQWGALNRHRNAMEVQSRRVSQALVAIQQAAEAAVANAKSAERSLNVVIDKQRARLEVTLAFAKADHPAEDAHISVRIRNTGETAAIGVKSKATCDVSDRSNAPKEPTEWHHSNRLEPGEEDSLDVFPAPPMTDDELEAIRHGKSTIRVRVKTEFTDVFGIKRRVHTGCRLETILIKGSMTPRFEWTRNPTKCFETEEREHASAEASAAPRVTTESGSLLQL
jgi:hypothetical protein